MVEHHQSDSLALTILTSLHHVSVPGGSGSDVCDGEEYGETVHTLPQQPHQPQQVHDRREE